MPSISAPTNVGHIDHGCLRSGDVACQLGTHPEVPYGWYLVEGDHAGLFIAWESAKEGMPARQHHYRIDSDNNLTGFVFKRHSLVVPPLVRAGMGQGEKTTDGAVEEHMSEARRKSDAWVAFTDGMLGGDPCFNGTRLSVMHIGKRATKDSVQHILDDHRTLNYGDVMFAQKFYEWFMRVRDVGRTGSLVGEIAAATADKVWNDDEEREYIDDNLVGAVVGIRFNVVSRVRASALSPTGEPYRTIAYKASTRDAAITGLIATLDGFFLAAQQYAETEQTLYWRVRPCIEKDSDAETFTARCRLVVTSKPVREEFA